jgi:hypothetical protein
MPDWPNEAVRSAAWKIAKDAALEKWQTGSADTTQMLASLRAALESVMPELLHDTRLHALDEAEAAIRRWSDICDADRSTPYREGKADGAIAALTSVERLRGEAP